MDTFDKVFLQRDCFTRLAAADAIVCDLIIADVEINTGGWFYRHRNKPYRVVCATQGADVNTAVILFLNIELRR